MGVNRARRLEQVFAEDVLERWRKVRQPSSHLTYRLTMLDRHTLPPDGWTVETIERKRAAYGERMEGYLEAAFACGLLGNVEGADLIAKLTGTDDANFRSACTECLAAWYLGTRLGLELQPRPAGRRGRPLELAIMDSRGTIHVEVKAPRRDAVMYTLDEVRAGAIMAHQADDSDIVRERVNDARKQFDSTTRNLVFLGSDLTLQDDFVLRSTLTKALYGQVQLVAQKRRETHEIGQFQRVCMADGLFLRHGAAPRYTRISGVLCVEESHDVGASPLDFLAYLVHNPYAMQRLPPDLWDDVPQLDLHGDRLVWSDEDEAEGS
jgi:hypothetical protein